MGASVLHSESVERSESPAENLHLAAGVAAVPALGRSEVGENAPKTRRRKIPRGGEKRFEFSRPDAEPGHARVHLQVIAGLFPEADGRFGKGSQNGQGITRGREGVFYRDAGLAGVYASQKQYLAFRSRFPKFHSLGDRGDSQHVRAAAKGYPTYPHGAVSVGVGLDDGHDARAVSDKFSYFAQV